MTDAASSYSDGVTLYQKGNYRVALQKFEAAERAGEQKSNALYYQALCWNQLGQNRQATQLYERIIKDFSTSPAAASARSALQQLAAANGGPQSQAASPSQQSLLAFSNAMSSSGSSEATLRLPGDKSWYMGLEKGICEIPFTQTAEGMVVPVTVNGHLVPAIWDTGASGMFFTKSQLDRCNVDLKTAKKAGRAIGVGGEIPVLSLDCAVKIGTQVENLSVMVQDDTAQARAGGTLSQYGLIGQDFFGRYVYEIDGSARVIRLLKRTNVQPGYAKADARRNPNTSLGEPFTFQEGVIIVTPKINGRECDMILDTGATLVAFSDKQLTAAGLNRPVDSSVGMSRGVGGTRNSFQFKLDTVSLGPVTRNDVTANVSVYGSISKPLLGMTFLGGLRYIIDPERRIIRFQQAR